MASSVSRSASAVGEKSLNVSAILRRYGRCGLKSVTSDLGLARHDGLSGEKLGEDAAGAPEINGDTILSGTKQELRRPVPERDDTAGHGLPLGRVKERGEPKVRDPEHAIVVDEEVGALDVAVEDATRVAVSQPLEDLCHEALDLRLREALPGQCGEAGQVVLHVLEHEVEAVGETGCHDAFQLDHVRVVQATEDVDLTSHETHALWRWIGISYLVEAFERVGAPGEPALDDLAGDGGEPGGPAGDDVLAGEALGNAGDDLHAVVRGAAVDVDGGAAVDLLSDDDEVMTTTGGAVFSTASFVVAAGAAASPLLAVTTTLLLVGFVGLALDAVREMTACTRGASSSLAASAMSSLSDWLCDFCSIWAGIGPGPGPAGGASMTLSLEHRPPIDRRRSFDAAANARALAGASEEGSAAARRRLAACPARNGREEVDGEAWRWWKPAGEVGRARAGTRVSGGGAGPQSVS
nr:unnamed protein product [Digitaria exilis]